MKVINFLPCGDSIDLITPVNTIVGTTIQWVITNDSISQSNNFGVPSIWEITITAEGYEDLIVILQLQLTSKYYSIFVESLTYKFRWGFPLWDPGRAINT